MLLGLFGQRNYSVWFESSKIYWSWFYGSAYALLMCYICIILYNYKNVYSAGGTFTRNMN